MFQIIKYWRLALIFKIRQPTQKSLNSLIKGIVNSLFSGLQCAFVRLFAVESHIMTVLYIWVYEFQTHCSARSAI